MTDKTLAGQEIIERAQKDLAEGNLDVAERAFNYLLDRNKGNPDLWFFSGTCAMQRGYRAQAEIMLKKCLSIDPGAVAAYNNLGSVYKEENRDKEAEECFRKAIKIFPKTKDEAVQREIADIWNNLATLYVNNGTPDKAIEYCNKGLEVEPNNTKLLWNKSLAELEKGDWKQGWKDYEADRDGKKRKKRDYGDIPVWDGTPGKTVIVYGEQGIGDEILFMSMINDLKKKCNVIIDCHPRMANIFRDSFPDIPVYGTRKEEFTTWHNLYKVDAKIACGSLGQFFRNSDEDFPKHEGYLVADKAIVQKYKEKLAALGSRPKIGISWKGGYMSTRKDLRTIFLDKWRKIFEIDADFISLQYTHNAHKEAEEAEKLFGVKIHHWQDTIDDYDETAGLVKSLDLVISVCTSVIHLSGALNVPCFVLTPARPAWRYGIERRDMVWYPSVTLYRQTRDGWEDVMSNVKEDTCSLFQNRIAA